MAFSARVYTACILKIIAPCTSKHAAKNAITIVDGIKIYHTYAFFAYKIEFRHPFNFNRFARAHSISSKNIETPSPPGRKAFLQHTHVRLNLLP